MAEAQILKIKLENVRISRVSLATPFKNTKTNASGEKGKDKYHVDAILDDKHPQFEAVRQLMRAAIVNKFKDEAPVVQQQIVANNKLALHRGDIDRAGKPEYAGKYYISANNEDQPTIVVFENGISISNRGTPEVLTPTHAKFPYSGCYADVILTFFAYAHPSGSKGVSAQLDGVMFRKHGEKLRGSSVAAVGEFTPPPPEDADEEAPAAQSGADGLL
jgi:hypothetical protein